LYKLLSKDNTSYLIACVINVENPHPLTTIFSDGIGKWDEEHKQNKQYILVKKG
jgi:hypothetical protein